MKPESDGSSDPNTRRAPHMERWVEIRPVVMPGCPDARHVFLVVDQQSFCVTPWGCETLEEAEWMRDMLCIAIGKIVATSEMAEAIQAFIEEADTDKAPAHCPDPPFLSRFRAALAKARGET